MRVRVALPIAKPIRRGAFIAGSDGVRTWVKFKYERLSMFCHYCGMLGHDVKHCASHFAVVKNGGEVNYQYGDFLRAMGVGHTFRQIKTQVQVLNGIRLQGMCNTMGPVWLERCMVKRWWKE